TLLSRYTGFTTSVAVILPACVPGSIELLNHTPEGATLEDITIQVPAVIQHIRDVLVDFRNVIHACDKCVDRLSKHIAGLEANHHKNSEPSEHEQQHEHIVDAEVITKSLHLLVDDAIKSVNENIENNTVPQTWGQLVERLIQFTLENRNKGIVSHATM